MATDILKETETLDSPAIPESPEYAKLQKRFSATLDDLRRLIDGPRRFAGSFIRQGNGLAAFKMAFDFDFFSLVPVGKRCAGGYVSGLRRFHFSTARLDEMWKAASGHGLDRQVVELRDNFPWGELTGTVVDLGGGSSHVSMELTQDIFTTDIVDRVSFREHDFFNPQPVRNASAVFIRQCLHNWCDSDVIKILRALIPALENSAVDASILINDTIMREPGILPLHEERGLWQMDMLTLLALGAKQRSRAEIEHLWLEADPRYRVLKVRAEGSVGLIEVKLDQVPCSHSPHS
ncbi:S-adenosyl-L-methionine-dependent methyltransferase [Nemania serpens]|nr:S-adenosyl-L-methionine-dependent methyltransferase [Nemania serpens]